MVIQAIDAIQYGSVEIIIHDGQIVQIESREKTRIAENIRAPKIKFEFGPHQDLKFDGGYSWFWLASKTDRFNNLLGGRDGNRDRTGNSGDFLGHAIDFRAIYKSIAHADIIVGYSQWINGEFVKNRQLAQLGETTSSTNFFYVEVSVSAFK